MKNKASRWVALMLSLAVLGTFPAFSVVASSVPLLASRAPRIGIYDGGGSSG